MTKLVRKRIGPRQRELLDELTLLGPQPADRYNFHARRALDRLKAHGLVSYQRSPTPDNVDRVMVSATDPTPATCPKCGHIIQGNK